MTPLVRRYSDGLLIQFDYPLGPRVTVPLEWDEAESLMIQLRHELEDHDRADGVLPDAPAQVDNTAGVDMARLRA